MINTPKIYKMRIVFRLAQDPAKHLNIFNAVRKMILASGLATEPAKVNPHWPRFAYGPAAAQDMRTEREYVDIYLRKRYSREEVTRALVQGAPPGLEILQVVRVPYPLPSVQNLAAAARYRVQGDFVSLAETGRELVPIEVWAGAKDIYVSLRADNGIVNQQSLRPFVREAVTLSPQEVALTLVPVKNKWVPAQWVIAAWLGIEVPAPGDSFQLEELIFTRQTLYWQDSQGEFHPM